MGLGKGQGGRSRQGQQPGQCLALISLTLGCSLGLTACFGLNEKQIAETIRQDVIKNGGLSLKSVTCPKGIKPEAGKTFECVGEVDNGYTFTIPVQQRDTKGTVTWEIPQAKGLLNLPKLETVIQTALAKEIPSQPSVTCGGQYKALHPGEGFECRVAYKIKQPVRPPKPKANDKAKSNSNSKTKDKTNVVSAQTIQVTQTEKIIITTDTDGNLNWQRQLPPNLNRLKS